MTKAISCPGCLSQWVCLGGYTADTTLVYGPGVLLAVGVSGSLHRRHDPRVRAQVSQDTSEPDEWEPFRFILALVAGFLGTIPIYPDPSGRIFGNHQDISEPSRRSLAHMNF